jgi:hypothetical protein
MESVLTMEARLPKGAASEALSSKVFAFKKRDFEYQMKKWG